MTTADSSGKREAGRHRLLVRGTLRAAVSAVVVIGIYFIGPLDQLRLVPLGIALVIGGAVLIGISIWQINAIMRSPYPGIRATEALAITAPLYLILFAATYFLMAVADPSNFSAQELTRADTLYFTVTIFSTVGFGDIYPASESARLLVSAQMILNLLVLGAGIRVFMGAVQRSRESKTTQKPDVPTEGDK
ncbi:MAG: potassium channel family protein [Microbacterium sp.]